MSNQVEIVDIKDIPEANLDLFIIQSKSKGNYESACKFLEEKEGRLIKVIRHLEHKLSAINTLSRL